MTRSKATDNPKFVSYSEMFVSQNPVLVGEEGQIWQSVKYYSEKYGVNFDELWATVKGETCKTANGTFYHTNCYGDSGKAFGFAQFHESTYNAYCSDLQGTYKAISGQSECMAYMFSIGEEHQWTAWRNLKSHTYGIIK